MAISLETVIGPLISAVIVVIIYIITRSRQQGDTALLTNAEVTRMLKEREDRREEEKERDKDLRADMRRINESINNLTSSINLHSHMFNESKEVINELREGMSDVRNRLYVLEIKIGRNGQQDKNRGATH